MNENGGRQVVRHQRQQLHEPDLILRHLWRTLKVEERDGRVLKADSIKQCLHL